MVPKILTFLLILMSLSACSDQTATGQQKDLPPQSPVAGKWALQKRMFDPDTTYITTPDSIEYFKMLTEKSFVWYTYNKNSRQLMATGGGTYTLEGESYIEYLEFNHPRGSGVEGSTIPFRCIIEGDLWQLSGFINEREYDEEIGDYVVVKERRLEEIWKKVE